MRLACWCSLACLLAPAVAGAQAYDPSLAVEVYSSPIVAPASIMGRGGATLAISEGVGALGFNPAAVANRLPHNGASWFDWDWSIDFMSVGFAGQADVENSGRAKSDADDVLLVRLSLGVMFGRLGLGMSLGGTTFGTCLDPAVAQCDWQTRAEFGTLLSNVAAGYNFFDGQLVVGADLVGPTASFAVGGEASQHKYRGAGIGLGAVFRPHAMPLRFGVSARGPIVSERSDAGDGELVAGRLLPDRLVVPPHVGIGVAYGFGERPLNMRGSFGDEALPSDELALGRRVYTVLAADVLVVGTSARAVGAGAWVAQQAQRAGEHVTVSPRLGLESELSEDFFRGRLGTYWEPSRFLGVGGRLHGTLGFDVRLFELVWVWRLSSAVDGAREFLNLSLSLGFWH